MNQTVKIPGIKEVAQALRLKPPDESGLGRPILFTPSGVRIEVKREGRGHRYFNRVVVVIETGGYPATRRKVYLYKGAMVSYEFDKVVARPLTVDEKKKIKAKYAEMRQLQKEIDEGYKARERAQEDKDNARKALEEAVEKAGIDRYGDDDVPGLSLSVYEPKITLTLHGEDAERVVAIYNAVKKAVQKERG